MIWPWRRRHTPEHLGEGAAAAAAATAGLEQEKARTAQVRQVSEELRQHRERNHFAEMLEESMRVAEERPAKPRRRLRPVARHRRGRPA